MQRHGYSLATILLFTTVVAIVAAAISTGIKNRQDVNEDAFGMVAPVGAVLGVVVGTCIAYGRTRKIRWALLGVVIGYVAGCVAGVLAAMPPAAPAVLLGAVIVIVYSTVVHALSARRASGRPKPPVDDDAP